jgi:hypothetical protein
VFVPSLSWQNDALYIYKRRKKWRFSHHRRRNGYATNTRFFLSFHDLCPEPVLVKDLSSFHVSKGDLNMKGGVFLPGEMVGQAECHSGAMVVDIKHPREIHAVTRLQILAP